MGFMFNLDFPSELAANGTHVLQYAQFRKELDLEAPWITVVCKTVVGGLPHSAEVRNYVGYTPFVHQSGQNETMVNAADLVTAPMEDIPFFKPRPDDPELYTLE
jgi:hypothetical protein